MDIDAARQNMLKQQIRAWDVLDETVLELILNTPRELFVPPAYRQVAFADDTIPLDHDQIMMSPCVEGRIIQALDLNSEDKVLEIGTGSGYLTALLASATQHVYSVDIFSDFLTAADAKLTRLEIKNVTLQEGNAAFGWDKQQPYDVICITGAVPVLPKSFQHELKIGGRLFAIVGDEYAKDAILVTRIAEDEWRHQKIFETDIPYLLRGPVKKQFHF